MTIVIGSIVLVIVCAIIAWWLSGKIIGEPQSESNQPVSQYESGSEKPWLDPDEIDWSRLPRREVLNA